MSKSPDYYDTLGIKRDATQDEIKRAYRGLARVHHPDNNPDDKKATQKFQVINEAYGTLSDPEKRRKYDLTLPSEYRSTAGFGTASYSRSTSSFSSSGWSYPSKRDESFFSGAKFFSSGPTPNSSTSASASSTSTSSAYSLDETFKTRVNEVRNSMAKAMADVLHNANKFTSASKPQAPPDAHRKSVTANFTLEQLYRGDTVYVDLPHGITSKKMKVEIPRGAASGDLIEGAEYPYDFCIVQEIPHPRFKREGNDLVVTVDVTLLQALAGVTLNIQGLGSQPVTCLIQNQVISPGYTHRLFEEGMPIRGKAGKGDMLVKFNIVFPLSMHPQKKEQLKEGFSGARWPTESSTSNKPV